MEQLTTKVFELVGTASTCWIPDTGNAVFDEVLATKVSNGLIQVAEDYAQRTCFARVFKALSEDPELYFGYQSNIAMPFKDRMQAEIDKIELQEDIGLHSVREVLHEVANAAAKQFLDMLIKCPGVGHTDEELKSFLSNEDAEKGEATDEGYQTTQKSEGGVN